MDFLVFVRFLIWSLSGLGLTIRVFLDGPGGEPEGDRGVTLVKEGEPGQLGGQLDEPGELGGKLGELEGPGGIANHAGIFIPPAKLSLISFNNFIMPSS